MTTRQRTGVRKIEDIEGGAVAWLHPGGADLDDALLALVEHERHDDEGSALEEAWEDDEPTDLPCDTYDLRVGYYRRLPWCPCGEGHTWHIEPADGPGRGVMLAVTWSNW